jgi:hypothetical protein
MEHKQPRLVLLTTVLAPNHTGGVQKIATKKKRGLKLTRG